MGELESVLGKRLFDSLREKEQEYVKLMKSWFAGRISQDELNIATLNLLNNHQYHLHNQLLLTIFNKCINFSTPSLKFSGFEPMHPAYYAVTERKEVDSEVPPNMAYEGFLLDHRMTLARLKYGAWEFGLEGSSSNTADLLMLATQHFIKNIITATITRRSGYKSKRNGFIHGIGTPTLNPWLKNVYKIKSEPFHSLTIDEGVNGFLLPTRRKTAEELERETAFNNAARDSLYDRVARISLYDLIVTLKLYPSLISSNFVNTVNCERIYAKLHHPCGE